MRHCEKQSLVEPDNLWSRDHCNYLGFQRARYISTLFGHNLTLSRWPEPSILYALSPERDNKKHVMREIETLEPLSRKINVTIDSSFGPNDAKALSNTIKRSFQKGEMCDKLTIICWNHHAFPEVAKLLECTPRNGCPDVYDGVGFDEIWEITFSYVIDSKCKQGKNKKQKLVWEVFGNKLALHFDPLAYGKSIGIY